MSVWVLEVDYYGVLSTTHYVFEADKEELKDMERYKAGGEVSGRLVRVSLDEHTGSSIFEFKDAADLLEESIVLPDICYVPYKSAQAAIRRCANNSLLDLCHHILKANET